MGDEAGEYDELDGRIILAVAREGGAVLPPRRSYLWGLLRRSFGQAVAAEAITIERQRGLPIMADAPVIGAGLFRYVRMTLAGVVEAERIGCLVGRCQVDSFTTLAPMVTRVFTFDVSLPRSWHVPPRSCR